MTTILLLASAAAPAAAQGKRACEADRDLLAIFPPWSALMVSAQNGDRAVYRRRLTEIADLVRRCGRRYGVRGPTCEEFVCNALRTLRSERSG